MHVVHPTLKVSVHLVSYTHHHVINIFMVSHSPPESPAIAFITRLLTLDWTAVVDPQATL